MADLQRFVAAQAGGVFEQALAEIEAGGKRGHWIWFIFPQLAGLGHSTMSLHYGIENSDEAAAYLRHPVLGPRLIEISTATLRQLRMGTRLERLMASRLDALKLVSSMTLFEHAAVAVSGTDRSPAGFVSIASEILVIAESQGFPRCQSTFRLLAPPDADEVSRDPHR